MKKYLILAILLSITIPSCKDSSNPTNFISEDYFYPLKIGNNWSYHLSTTFTNISNDSVKNDFNDIEINSIVTVTDTVIIADSIAGFILTEESEDNQISFGYYSNEENGFKTYAYRNSGQSLPKNNSLKKIYFNSIQSNNFKDYFTKFNNVNTFRKNSSDSITFYDEPRTIYKYPFINGEEWNYISIPIIINKIVEGVETVQTASGNFECIKIRWKYDIDGDGNWDNEYQNFEYVSSQGLIKTIFIAKQVSFTTEYSLEVIGYADITYENVLINYSNN